MKTLEQIAEERNDEKIKAAKKYAKQYEGLMYTIGSIAGVSGIQRAFERGVAFGLHQALEITVEREKAERAAEQHWISVKERLPEIDQDVLVIKDGLYGLACRKIVERQKLPPPQFNNIEIWEWDYGFEAREGQVTHWQKLPEPPKEEK